ncbi:unnamed protein product [Microthlaspi erraticum]|uniref:Transposase MuDR plant domain-containing protein n=1 Tax=Microthlaspi erraticum TaxID=1685480 RepID=A0A6D2JNT8_9BRAS|nr:unnamed protein product [Microthlaspi erraticum]
MTEHCLVMCGDWRCSASGGWDFMVDKTLMSRVVSVSVGISLVELKERVVAEFFPRGRSALTVALSYWPPNTAELATGIRTPPVLLTNEGSISFFFKHYNVNHSMNLFVTFGYETPDNLEECYITPGEGKKRPNMFDDLQGHAKKVCPVSAGVSSCSTRVGASVLVGKQFSFEGLGDSRCKGSDKGDSIGVSGGYGFDKSKTNSKGSSSGFRNSDDAFGRDSKFMEDVFFGDPLVGENTEFVDGLIASDSDDSCGELPSETCDVRPVGYDKEFWMPMINDPFGGSDAVDIMCPPSEGFDGKAAAAGKRRQVLCSTNDAFDHYIVTGGSSPDVKAEGDPPRTSVPVGGFDYGRSFVADRRSLDHIDDEEFDIPPLFDDTKYVSDNIPDLDIDDGGGGIFEGRMFNSKEECQIALAIYAIKEMFHFRQSTTKRHYFIATCVDPRCEWRIRAKEVGDCGYYEIQKASLGHSCCIDSRNAYKKKASSRVIAAVFRAKYGDPEKGPRASELQRMVLEELRVHASYMKCYRAKEKASVDVRGTEEDPKKYRRPATRTRRKNAVDESCL